MGSTHKLEKLHEPAALWWLVCSFQSAIFYRIRVACRTVERSREKGGPPTVVSHPALCGLSRVPF